MSDVKDWWNRITNCRADVTPDHVLEAMHKAWKNAKVEIQLDLESTRFLQVPELERFMTAPKLDLESTVELARRVLTDTWDPAEPYPDEPGTHGPCYRKHANIVCKCERCQPGVNKHGTG